MGEPPVVVLKVQVLLDGRKAVRGAVGVLLLCLTTDLDARWGTDDQVPDVVAEAFEWLLRHRPTETAELSVCWGDARLSNAIFDDSGQIVGALDWEQACLCPAELDFAWWLATRRQMLEVNGLELDPELPGFDSRDEVIRRYEDMIGRPLENLDWYEIFAMVRMGCCILPAWTIAAIRA